MRLLTDIESYVLDNTFNKSLKSERRLNIMYTEDTVLDYGSYKNTRIKDIPKVYLINVYRSGGREHEKLIEWIQANIERFPILALYSKKGGPVVTFKCDKRTFPTKRDAMESIVKPKSKTNKPTPLRAYECPECSGWHLTSKPDRRFQNEGQD